MFKTGELSIGKMCVDVHMRSCIYLSDHIVCVHIFIFCGYCISLDACVYTPNLPSVTHSDIDLCMASLSVCVYVHMHTRTCTHQL